MIALAKKVSLWDQCIDEKRLTTAWRRVEANHGSAGDDGISIEKYAENLSLHLSALRAKLMEGRYVPGNVRIVTIHGANKDREIAILNVEDRVVHQAVYQLLQPIIEPLLPDSVYGFRPRRSAKACVQDIVTSIQKYCWVFETDIASFFDTIPISPLLERLYPYLPDEKLFELIRNILENHWKYSGVEEDHLTGILQGSPLSPLLSNFYLIPLDGKMNQEQIRYYRYADDVVALGVSRTEVQKAAYFISESLKSLQLNLKLEKTRFRSVSEGFEFLGFTINEKGG